MDPVFADMFDVARLAIRQSPEFRQWLKDERISHCDQSKLGPEPEGIWHAGSLRWLLSFSLLPRR